MWIVAALASAWVAAAVIPWGGIPASKENHFRIGSGLGEAVDFLVIGDSKVGPFEEECVMNWIPGLHGVVYTADSVTPVYYLDLLQRIRASQPDFSPEVVFIFIGANNMAAAPKAN